MKARIRSVYRSLGNLIDTPAIILLYHRVTALTSDPQQLAVTPENFFDHLVLLKKKYTLLSVEEFSRILTTNKQMPGNAVVITFDDGYADNLLQAIPILENLEVNALFFLATSGIDTRFEFWWDNLERMLLLGHPIPDRLSLKTELRTYDFATSTPEDRLKTYEGLHPIIKDHCSPNRDKLMEFMIRWSGLSTEGRESHRVLTSDEAIRLSRSKSATLGAHTHTHPKLSACSYDQQWMDISSSRKKLEDITGHKIAYFSFPFGNRSDYNRTSVRICKSLGFKFVCSNFSDPVHRWTSRFELPRVLVRNWNVAGLEKVINTMIG